MFWISAVPLASLLFVSYSNIGTFLGLGPAARSLDQNCQFYLFNSLALSTRRVYRSAQRQFIDFCTLDCCVSSNGSLLLASEQALMGFSSHLVHRLHHSIRSLHIDHGFSDPLVNCLQLQRLLRGTKRHQGSSLPQRQPVTADLMRII